MRLGSCLVSLILPAAVWWVRREEQFILENGVPLDERGLKIAAEMGVADPAAIRVVIFDGIPARSFHWLFRLGRKMGVFLPEIAGLTLGHGIYINRDCAGDDLLIAHECVHAGQYERLGKRCFLREYLRDSLLRGYPNFPLETEAIERSSSLHC